MVTFDLSYHHIAAAAIMKRALIVFVTWVFIPFFGMLLLSSLFVMSLGLATLGWVACLLVLYIVVMFSICVVGQVFFFLRFRVLFDGTTLTIHRGFLAHRTIIIPVSVIEDIIVEQDAFDAKEGLANFVVLPVPDVIIPTGVIDGLTIQQATTLRDHILDSKSGISSVFCQISPSVIG